MAAWIVDSSPPADAALQRLWLAARDRTALTEASAAADAALAADPRAVGESRVPEPVARENGVDHRLAFFPPLAVRFLIEPADRRVTILEIRRARPGPVRRRDS